MIAVESELAYGRRICPRSSVEERRPLGAEVAAKTTMPSRPTAGQGGDAVEASGATPAAGSIWKGRAYGEIAYGAGQ